MQTSVRGQMVGNTKMAILIALAMFHYIYQEGLLMLDGCHDSRSQ